MKTSVFAGFAWTLALCAGLGCSSQAIVDGTGEEGAGGARDPSGMGDSDVLELTVSPDGRTFVELSQPSEVRVAGDGEASIAWDLALRGREIFINGGISGPGNAGAFGPLSAPTYLTDTAPDVPLLFKDRAGGAFIDWYDYADHRLFSRYHVYGLRDGERLFKVQILGYYGQGPSGLVPALYRVRYAEVTPRGNGKTHDVLGIDASAGGNKDDDQEPSACLELDTEQVSPLTPDEARVSDAWQLCFRRESIAVNGGLSGPRGMAAVDLQAAATAHETEAEVQKRSPASELALFEGVDFAALDPAQLSYRTDGIVTAFGQRWLEPGSEPLAVNRGVWLVVGADGAAKYLLKFSNLVGDPAREAATLNLEAKSVR